MGPGISRTISIGCFVRSLKACSHVHMLRKVTCHPHRRRSWHVSQSRLPSHHLRLRRKPRPSKPLPFPLSFLPSRLLTLHKNKNTQRSRTDYHAHRSTHKRSPSLWDEGNLLLVRSLALRVPCAKSMAFGSDSTFWGLGRAGATTGSQNCVFVS